MTVPTASLQADQRDRPDGMPVPGIGHPALDGNGLSRLKPRGHGLPAQCWKSNGHGHLAHARHSQQGQDSHATICSKAASIGRPARGGYSLIEVLIASAVLLIGISAAAVMIGAISTQETTDARVAQALNMQEQAGRLWQLGLTPATVTNILPAKCSAGNPSDTTTIRLDFSETTNTTSLSPGVSMDILNPLRLVLMTGNGVYRTNDIVVGRPTIR